MNDSRTNSPIDPDALLREPQAAQLCGVKPRTLEAWRTTGDGPPFIRLSARSIRYQRRDILEWIHSRRVSSTAEYGDAA